MLFEADFMLLSDLVLQIVGSELAFKSCIYTVIHCHRVNLTLDFPNMNATQLFEANLATSIKMTMSVYYPVHPFVRPFGDNLLRQKSNVGISLLFIPSRLSRFSDLLTAAACATHVGS